MADRLTQLQDAIDHQLSLMYAAVNYIQGKHPPGQFPGQPSQRKDGEEAAATPGGSPHSPDEFEASLRELAISLVLQEQQIEYLISSLPGLGSSEETQERRMRELETELRVVRQERIAAERDKEIMIELLGNVITGLRS
ncbi:hypothetical protein K470DRAFT_271237 [Piedraia hortae CBS 480.64]|uniref:Mediator of RNA polymerase II transcription subunit 21 n=1 Tax=Piedraia hortae CBS 480.64 TaxID=1314780 RepID=A0A6A7BX69_9PEZI|nr:hypothetical protein K470DRAFT_271237 [Piedraia hortae CBS 480.64]